MRKTTVLLAVFASALLSLPLVTTGCGGSQGKPTTANVQPGSMPSGASWDGVYFNPVWGYLHLQQQGGNFDARWKRADESAWGEMHGTITGDIARFDWKEHKIGMVGPSATTKGRGYFRYTRPEGDNVDDRIIGHESNLWAMGPTGPCGFCSEIFYDQGPSVAGGPPGSPEQDGDRFLEFWNLVFMQYEQFNDGRERIPLPKPSIDTGMGLERISAIMQGVDSVFETDLFVNLINAGEDLYKVKAQGEQTASFRVIADHLRSSCFLIADGVSPSNEGR
ncbi:MAG TPA: alanine--tRNA ligase-related protein, partial [Polyangiaceae bacterium]|nr:alanine--tRNA ligase-related protein [Polyangiaceae bacterium]